eukprot:779644-Pelagomonas_calceolata.AAC.1
MNSLHTKPCTSLINAGSGLGAYVTLLLSFLEARPGKPAYDLSAGTPTHAQTLLTSAIHSTTWQVTNACAACNDHCLHLHQAFVHQIFGSTAHPTHEHLAYSLISHTRLNVDQSQQGSNEAGYSSTGAPHHSHFCSSHAPDS